MVWNMRGWCEEGQHWKDGDGGKEEDDEEEGDGEGDNETEPDASIRGGH